MGTDLTALTVRLLGRIQFEADKAAEGRTVSYDDTMSLSESLSFGTGSGKADMVWRDIRLLAASANEDIDLAGVLINAFGATVTFSTIKAIAIHNRTDETLTDPAHTATTADIQVTRPAANSFTGLFLAAGDGRVIDEGGWELFYLGPVGIAVTAGTGDLINIANADGTNEACYEILIVGESA